MNRNYKLIIGVVALLAVAGGGAAIAASESSTPSQQRQAVINDAAKRLGVSPAKLRDALEQALSDRVDAAVAAGRITKAQGEELKRRLSSGGFPLFGGPRRGFEHFGFFGKVDAAASYLGLTDDQLRSQLESGKTLAQIARDRGKSVSGLVDALVNAAKQHLDAAVKAGRLTQTEADQMLRDLRTRVTELVNNGFHGFRDRDGDGFRPPPAFGFRHFFRAPA